MLLECIITVIVNINDSRFGVVETSRRLPIVGKVLDIIPVSAVYDGYKHYELDFTNGIKHLDYSKNNFINKNLNKRMSTSEDCYSSMGN